MPQKAILTRYPLMDAAMCGLSRGLVRTDVRELAALYRKLEEKGDAPYTWEGLFSLACLLTDHPMEEPAAKRILQATGDTDDFAFPAGTDDQVPIARAAMAVYEYAADREILKRLARWCRWLEADWDKVKDCRWIRVQPADLMAFLVQFYRITGMKAVLRLCSRLRSSAMDWTTLLHDFHQRNPLNLPEMEKETTALFARTEFKEIDFIDAQYLSNHAEILADGMRYTAWAALYSGNGQEISAGRRGWENLRRYHSAVCGGTTGSIFLAGRGSDRGIHPATTAAWTEAMIAQAQMHAEPWALNETVRLAYNALADCLYCPEGRKYRYVNGRAGKNSTGTFDPEPDPDRDIRTSARLARAAAMLWQNAVTVTEDGIQLNYLLPGRYMIASGGKNAVLLADRDALHIRCRASFEMNLSLFCPVTETAQIAFHGREGAEKQIETDEAISRGGGTVSIRRTWEHLDTITFHQEKSIHTEETHHRGICIMIRNRIMSLNIHEGEYRYAVCGEPFIRNGQAFAPAIRIARWPERDGIPSDIPVLSAGNGESIIVPLSPYAETPDRIAVFPREAQYV